MPRTLTELTKDAAELTAQEQLRLARILLELSEGDANQASEADEAWETEIQRRLSELRSGQIKGISLETVKKKFATRFSS